ncbi:MAG: tRNA pseudouridine synthase A [Proteobacteria bacterium]|nr:tRNA pseudouridine synthase A [Pseudomonadota bacterium]
MSNFKLILEYNGENFSGSQIQNVKQSQSGTARNRTSSRLRRTNDRSVLRVHEDHEDDENAEIEDCGQSQRTVQGELDKALSIYFRSNIATNFSSRTDAGVHAIGQVVNFHLNQDDGDGVREPCHDSFLELVLLNPDKILIGLNGILPDDMAVVKIEPVGDDFDARFSATAREYMYKIFIRKHRPVLRLDSLIWVKESLDFNAMQAHAQKFLGEHDFSVYYRAESYVKNPVCNVMKSEMLQESGICFKYYIRSNRFLKNMVRRIVGELIQVGKFAAKGEDVSRLEPNFSVKNPNPLITDNNEAISKSTDSSLLKAKAEAPEGLTLMKVFY